MSHRYLIASALLLGVAPQAFAQGGPTPASVCALLSKAEVEKQLGRSIYMKGDGMALGKNGAVCDFDGDEATVMVFADPGADANWESMLKSFKQEQNKRTPVPGLGSSAYVIYPTPRNRHQPDAAMVVVRSGRHIVVVSTAAAEGKPATSALGPTIALTRLVLPRIK